jgi:hypothetical protein
METATDNCSFDLDSDLGQDPTSESLAYEPKGQRLSTMNWMGMKCAYNSVEGAMLGATALPQLIDFVRYWLGDGEDE